MPTPTWPEQPNKKDHLPERYNFVESINKLKALEKEIKQQNTWVEKTTNTQEQLRPKEKLRAIVKEAYRIMIDKMGNSLVSFWTWLDLQILSNTIETSNALRALKEEILANHNAKQRENVDKQENIDRQKSIDKQQSIEIQRTKEDDTKKIKKQLTTQSQNLTFLGQRDNEQMLQKASIWRQNAVQRIETRINETPWITWKILSWLAEKWM